jgi:hypothetical protein
LQVQREWTRDGRHKACRSLTPVVNAGRNVSSISPHPATRQNERTLDFPCAVF